VKALAFSTTLRKNGTYLSSMGQRGIIMLLRLKPIISSCLSKDLVLDLYDAVSARALAAHEMIRDHAALDEKRARMVVGRVRFPMQEKSFEEVCQSHGGVKLDCDVVPGTDLKFFQPLFRFAGEDVGVILGFASMPEGGRLPAENMSRKAGVTVNFDIEPRLDFDGKGPKLGDIYVIFLVARDPARPGHVAEVAVGVINTEYDAFVFYEPVEDFFSGYGDRPSDPTRPDDPDSGPAKPLVTLKGGSRPFEAPESVPHNDNESRLSGD
jgi:hypothetical protein